ncbi:hypothetical protein GUJ93_ZPchr0004g39178 [Zizania palustris]|uniref:Uncharacterized protein n=1 Tax=Zizania palustris TaxID=103762 RepID=A0A8J5SDM2_ZIZPA|nr:hypothetical protein GUJ93_ZPchr0004g39178 [Zizania palustris]
MSFVYAVTKSSPPVMVGPSGPTPAVTIVPTSTDMSRLSLSFTSFHVFEGRVHEPAETIRRALSRALVHYYPFAGRVSGGHGDGQEDVVFSCTGEGVVFVAATANCTLEDVRFLEAPLVIPLGDLAVGYGGPCRVSDPLMMVQVTEFACGGFVVGVTWNHGLADGFGLAQFLRAVGELARGLPSPSVVPVRYDESLPDIPQLADLLREPAAGFNLKPVDFSYCDVVIPWSFIRRVKAEFISRVAGRRCSVFEVVTAAIWQSRTRAIDVHRRRGGGALAPLAFTANVRKHVGAKDGYYGNCITHQLVAATGDAVADGDIVDVVKLINDAKERIPELLATKQLAAAVDNDVLVEALCGYRALYVSSWGGIGLDGVDFGGGTPARVMPNMEVKMVPTCAPCLPCSRKHGDGVNAIASCVTDEHLDVFQAELARLFSGDPI